jgi:hypothetical protein
MKVGTMAKAGMIAAALMGSVLFTASPASAAPSTSTAVASAPVPGAANCWQETASIDHWAGKCQVYSGYIRTVTVCANGQYKYGAWIGARSDPWYVYGECIGSSVWTWYWE